MSSNIRAETTSPDLTQGFTLQGRWAGKSYCVIRLLGSGANGKVYLVWRDQIKVALKLGEDSTAIALEYEHLREVAEKVKIDRIVPELFELEDVTIGGRTYPVLVMEWIDGIHVEEFIHQRGDIWIAVCLWKIIRLIETLHQQGYAFCDVKPANLLFELHDAEPRLIDFGGVTPIGQAAREFTEIYDRAWWGRGSRKADIAYDTFACAMLGLQLAHPIPKGELERLQKKSPIERSAFLDQQLHTSWPQDELRLLLREPLRGDAKLHSLHDALIPLLRGYLNPNGQLKNSALPRKRSRRRFDATDWGLLVSVITFTLALCALWWIGTL